MTAAGVATSAPAPASADTAGPVVFTSDGSYTIPAGAVALDVTVIGAAGTDSCHPACNPAGQTGAGAEVEATIPVPPGVTTLYADVDNADGGISVYAGQGGGSSDISTCAPGTCSLTGDPSSDPRLVVAGGGGGIGETSQDQSSAGGGGGNAGAGGLASVAGAGGSGTDNGSAPATTGGDAGYAQGTGAAGRGGPDATECGASGGSGSPAAGGAGGDTGYAADGGGGGGGWVGGGGGGTGSGNNGCGFSGSGVGGGGGAGLSYVESSATHVSVTSSTSAPEVVVSAVQPTDFDLSLSGVPSNITVDATSLAGAVVNYTAPTAVDEDNPGAAAVSCGPASGSTFAIGTTTVGCTATDPDDSNSPASQSFTVTVEGAAPQLSDLHTAVQGVGPGTSLSDKVATAQSDLASGLVGSTCSDLAQFVNEVKAQSGQKIPSAQAAALLAEARTIENVLGCSS